MKRSVLQARAWIDEAGGELPPGNSDEAELWGPSQPPPDSDEAAEVAGGTADGRVKISPFSQATVRLQSFLAGGSRCCGVCVYLPSFQVDASYG